MLLASTPDLFLWRNSPDSEPGQFNAYRTWETLFLAPATVQWHKIIWCKVRIPKHAFLAWVTILNRLPTRDRLRQWGSTVPASCLLCDSADESRDHLFVACSYSRDVWNFFFGNSTFSPPLVFDAIIQWLGSSSPNVKVRSICNLLVQAIVYLLWKERNSRLHGSSSRPFMSLVKEVKRTIKAKLFGLDRAVTVEGRHQSISASESYLQLWFRFFDI